MPKAVPGQNLWLITPCHTTTLSALRKIVRLRQECSTVQGQGSTVADLTLARQTLQAQDDQIREQSSQPAKMGEMLIQALELVNRNATAFQQAAASAPTGPVQAAGTASSSPPAADSSTAMETPGCAPRGQKATFRHCLSSTLPQLNYSAMTTRHVEIKIWTSYKEELTSWLCLLDDRCTSRPG